MTDVEQAVTEDLICPKCGCEYEEKPELATCPGCEEEYVVECCQSDTPPYCNDCYEEGPPSA